MSGANAIRSSAAGQPRRRRTRTFAVGLIGLAAAGATPLAAQTMSVQAITANTPNLANVASAASGDTLFSVDPSTGSITKLSGAGTRTSTATSRARVTVRCTGTAALCDSTRLRVRISNSGSPSGRLAALTSFSVSSGTATILSPPAPSNVIDFLIEPVGRNSNKTFWVGANMTVRGDESGLATGAATSGFNVRVAADPAVPATPGTDSVAIANVRRSTAITKVSDLNFGALVRPRTGSSTVGIDAATGVRTVGGNGVGLPSPAPHRAVYTITGEGGRTLSVSLPASFPMVHSNGSNSLTATLKRSPTGNLTLSGTAGGAGTVTLNVGGSFSMGTATLPGSYTGNFNITMQYN
ncbi:MAG: DUF4402 domain-containing protein [Sphingomonadaceae bacterium]|nr:DUF4402 domain-containing protein [Sphingomonadaceae bacterium]